MRRILFGAIMFTLIMTYYGCSSDSSPIDNDAGNGGCVGANCGGGDAGVEDIGQDEPCTVEDGVVGKPCTVANEQSDCYGLAASTCLDNSLCDTLTSSPPGSCTIEGGYCFKFIMGDDVTGNCGKGAWWLSARIIDPGTAAWLCVKCCVTDADCRSAENYWCWTDPTSGRGACVPNAFHEILDKDGGSVGPVDGGGGDV